ncbi:MAG: hypothetical protein EZS28_002494 [Streblomastix strix]|uniref:Uncharacterized protein n=1 Tax=Streblomastix strix TaxID=222440 RepID=A0A5J4X453_9EUKA|nr:MAG: hypothetical protein EZS28_002494 [Streblomastix strix]
MKLASLLLFICFIIINEAAETNLAISNIDCRNQTAFLCVYLKSIKSIEQYKIRRTGDPKDIPNSTLINQLNRTNLHYGKDVEHFSNFYGNLMGTLLITDKLDIG